MPLTQEDHIQATIRQFEAAIHQKREEARMLEENVAALRSSLKLLPTVQRTSEFADVMRPVRKRGYLRDAIRDWIREREKPEFAASELMPYLEARGFTSKYAYNNCFECLTKMAKDGELEKIAGGFKKKV